jgi:hypothetical protein
MVGEFGVQSSMFKVEKFRTLDELFDSSKKKQ